MLARSEKRNLTIKRRNQTIESKSLRVFCAPSNSTFFPKKESHMAKNVYVAAVCIHIKMGNCLSKSLTTSLDRGSGGRIGPQKL